MKMRENARRCSASNKSGFDSLVPPRFRYLRLRKEKKRKEKEANPETEPGITDSPGRELVSAAAVDPIFSDHNVVVAC